MNVQVEEIGALTRKVTITLPAELVQAKLKEAYDKVRHEVRLKGFRRGKVPKDIILKQFKNQVEGETSEKLVQDNYFTAIEKEGIDPIVHPDIKSVKYNDDGSFTFVVEVDIRPNFTLGQYKGLEVEKVEVLVTDEEVQLALEEKQKAMAALRSVTDRPAQNGDVVMIDFQGYHEGTAMPQVKNENFSVDIGSGEMGAEFETMLIGKNKDEEGSQEIDFPESHPNPILKGKKIEFRIKVKDIKERVLATIDDEFAKDAGEEFSTLEELKTSIRERLTKVRQDRAEGTTTDRIMQKLIETHEFELPKRLVTFEINQMIKQTEEQLEKNGLSLEAAGLSRETLMEQKAELAKKRVQGDFILKKIAETEGIKLVDEDMERGFMRIAGMYNMPVATVKEYFQNRDYLLPFIDELLNEKILAFLKEQTIFIDGPAAAAVAGTDVATES
ncbi:MAG: trigger factor [Desulforhopalus sp.]|nr:trigger factor [Desulforhopalus sp.]